MVIPMISWKDFSLMVVVVSIPQTTNTQKKGNELRNCEYKGLRRHKIIAIALELR